MNIWRFAASVAVVLSVAACGGGGGSAPADSPIQGLWTGTTGSGRTFGGLALDDGTYWFFYSPVANPSLIAGAVQGNASASNGTFSSNNGRDFNMETWAVYPFTMSGTYTAKSSLNGTITYSASQSETFTSTYDASYELTPSLSTIAGTYVGQSATPSGIDNIYVTISSTGAVSGSASSGCLFTGTAIPRSKGNAYNVSITFGSNCAGTITVSGVGHFDAGSNLLRSFALNGARTDGYIFVGVKQ